jgi:hypothetical protein
MGPNEVRHPDDRRIFRRHHALQGRDVPPVGQHGEVRLGAGGQGPPDELGCAPQDGREEAFGFGHEDERRRQISAHVYGRDGLVALV